MAHRISRVRHGLVLTAVAGMVVCSCGYQPSDVAASATPSPLGRPTIVAEASGENGVPMEPASPSPTVAPQPVPTPAQPAVSVVPAAPPVRLEIQAIGLTTTVEPLSPEATGLTPPRVDRAYWWRERGQAGTNSQDTVYLIGHSVRDPAVSGAFERLQELVPGGEVVVTTSEGVLTYMIHTVASYPKGAIVDADEVYASVPGRLVLVGCVLREDGAPQTDNVVVTASLHPGRLATGLSPDSARPSG